MIYRAYGLTLSSELSLPDLCPSSAPPEVEVRFGATAPRLSAPIAAGIDWQAERDRVLISSAGVGRFLIDQRQIVITPDGRATPEQLAFVIVQACLAPLLQLRGALVLHAAAVAVPGRGVVALAGQSASGKSTLLMACVRRGWSMITDELSAVRANADAEPCVAPGRPVIHAWREALDYFQVPTRDLLPVRPQLQKYRWPVAALPDEAQPLSAIVLIEPTEPPAIRLQRVDGAAAFALLRAQVRAARIAEAVQPAAAFTGVADLAARVPVFRLARPDNAIESVDALIDCLASVPV